MPLMGQFVKPVHSSKVGRGAGHFTCAEPSTHLCGQHTQCRMVQADRVTASAITVTMSVSPATPARVAKEGSGSRCVVGTQGLSTTWFQGRPQVGLLIPYGPARLTDEEPGQGSGRCGGRQQAEDQVAAHKRGDGAKGAQSRQGAGADKRVLCGPVGAGVCAHD